MLFVDVSGSIVFNSMETETETETKKDLPLLFADKLIDSIAKKKNDVEILDNDCIELVRYLE